MDAVAFAESDPYKESNECSECSDAVPDTVTHNKSANTQPNACSYAASNARPNRRNVSHGRTDAESNTGDADKGPKPIERFLVCVWKLRDAMVGG